jgi:hypothetical protein
MAGILGGLLGGSDERQSQGGLLGLLSDPMKQAHLAMILKGLSPHSGIDPQQMMAQAQRIKLQREERQREELRRAQDIAMRREFHSDALKQQDRQFGLQEDRFSRQESLDKAKQDKFDAQQSGDSDLYGTMGGAPVATPPPGPVSFNESFSGGADSGALTGDSAKPASVTPAQQALIARAKSLEDALRRNPQASAASKKAAFEELERIRSKIGIPDDVADPDAYRKKLGTEQGEAEGNRRTRETTFGTLMKQTDVLEEKIKDPRFGDAAGPFVEEASRKEFYDPRRWIYEAKQSQESKTFLERIKQDAQAINSSLQRILLEKQGQVTENERLQINDILGKIAGARSAEEARGHLDNFRTLAGNMFGKSEQSGDTLKGDKPRISKEEALEELRRRGRLK